MKRNKRPYAAWGVILLATRGIGTSIVFVAAAASAFARDIHVDASTGDDRFNGQSLQIASGLQGPVRTLQKAVRMALPGDRVVVNPTGVPFHEEVVINGVDRPNPRAFPIVIEGNGALLDGLVPIDPASARHLGGGLFQFETALGPTHTSDVLFVDGAPAVRGTGRWASGMPMIGPGEFAPWKGWFCYQLGPNGNLDRHSFAVGRLNVGLTIYRSNHWIIRNLAFRGYRIDGVRLHGPVEGIQFQHCRFLSNGRAGIAAHGLVEAGVQDSESLGNGKAGIVSRNLSRLGVARVRAEGNPVAVDADPSTSMRVIPGNPQPAPTAPPRRPTPRPLEDELRRRPEPESDDL